MGGAGIRDAGADFAQPAVSRLAVGRGGLYAAFRVFHHQRVVFTYHER